jgi:predicted nucleic acid-binding protein
VIVLDASAALELLLNRRAAAGLRTRLFAAGQTLHAPEVIDLEVLQVLRRFVRDRDLSPERAIEALHDYRDLGIEHYSHELLLDRVWELRANLTSYDAAYVALAELLGASLVTADQRLARSPGHKATVELIA